MTAAAQLIGEVGWGRVTTRAVAERAGLPHGAVSYHFRGKQDLLAAAAMWTFEQAFPAESVERAATLDTVLDLVGNAELIASELSRLMLETMREAERDPALGARLRAMLVTYRGFVVDVLRAEQERGTIPADLPVEPLAVLLLAVGDGLAVHALLDPDLDVAASLGVFRTLLGRASH